MKFIHFRDIRIGSPSDNGSRWSSARQGERFATLQRVLDFARAEKVNLVLITGGLFSHQPVTSEMDRVNAIFRQYPELEFVIIAGSSDPVHGSSPVLSYRWDTHVHYITGSSPERIMLSGLKTEIHGVSTSEGMDADLSAFMLADLQTAIDTRPAANFTMEESRQFQGRLPIRLALLCSAEEDMVRKIFQKLDFTYVAVGSEGGRREIVPGQMCDPGSLEPESMQDGGTHGIYMGEADEQTGKLLHLEFKPMAAASYVPLKISVTPKTTAEELEQMVLREIERRGDKNIYRLKLTGSRDPGQVFTLTELKDKYRISELIDETEPVYDFEALFAEHPQDMIGYYIGTIIHSGREMSSVEKKAMYYGIDALLQTAGGGTDR